MMTTDTGDWSHKQQPLEPPQATTDSGTTGETNDRKYWRLEP